MAGKKWSGGEEKRPRNGEGKAKSLNKQQSLEQIQLKPYKQLIPVQAPSASAISSSPLAELRFCINIVVARGKLEGSLHF